MSQTQADQQTHREARLRMLLDEYGCARECDVPALVAEGTYIEAGPSVLVPIPRWALMEADKGSADNGGPWWSLDDDWRKLLDASANQEYPDDWPATMLFDLNGSWETEVESRYEPVVDPDSVQADSKV